MSKTMRHLKAMLWLHAIRTTRYMAGLVNWALVDALWVTIYVLGALAFTPPDEYASAAPPIFWAIFAWTLISTPVWVIGNWMGFYVNIGVYEEHELIGVNHSLFLSLRTLPALLVSIATAGTVGGFLAVSLHVNPFIQVNPALLMVSMAAMTIMAVIYSLTIAYASLALSTPAPLLDIMNFFLFIAGGIAVPVEKLPTPLQVLAVATPYSHPAELMRAAVIPGYTPYLGARNEMLASLFFVFLLYCFMKGVQTWSRSKILRDGIRGIGRM